MSLTAFERANPPPRRKSCAACTKAKRRCDLGQPSCLRCSGRGIDCHYPHLGGQPYNPQRMAPSPNTTNTTATSLSFGGDTLGSSSSLSSSSSAGSPSSPAPLAPPSVTFDPTPLPTPGAVFNKTAETYSFDNLLDEFLARDPAASLNGPLGGDLSSYGIDMVQESSPQSSINIPGLGNHDLLMTDETRQLVPLEYRIPDRLVNPPCGESLPAMIEDRLQYSLELFRRTPKSLVEQLETPWYHPSLYDDHMLKTIQDSIACCAMYNARNERNKPYIIKILMARTKELADTPIPPSPSEALARCQALLMYHLIGLLDEDIQLRANTQVTLPVLRDAARSLIDLVAVHETQYNLSNTRQLPLFPIAETEAFWRAWLFAESARRTALLSFNFIVLYEIMTRKGIPECGDSMRCERFSLQKRLWGARNAVDFAVAWKHKKHLVMRCETLDEIIRDADPSDLDDFGRMLLTCFMGKEETRGWFASKGGVL